MMSSRPFLAALLGVTVFASVASAQVVATRTAQTPPVSVDQRIQWQLERIRQGVQAGQITPAERQRLLARETVVRMWVREIRASGQGVSPADRQQVMRALNLISAAIDRAIHKPGE